MSDTVSEYDFVDHAVFGRLARLQLLPRSMMEGSFTGMHRSPHRGSSVEFAEYRKYVPGDDIRHIDWRVFAKTDRFYLKEFEADTNMRLCLVLDASASMGFEYQHGSKLQYARRLAAALAYLAIHQGDSVGLHCLNDKLLADIPARSSAVHLQTIYQTMNEVPAQGKTSLINILHTLAEKIRRRAFVVIISDFFTELDPLMDCLQHMRFRKHDVSLFHILDEQELAFEFDRPIRFVDMESNYSMISEPGIIKSNYQSALHKYLDDIKRGAMENDADYRRFITSADYEEELSKFLLERLHR